MAISTWPGCCIAAGVKVNETGADGTHVLPFAIVAGQADFAQFLLEQGADPNGAIDGVRALHAAVGNVNTWLDDWTRKHGRHRPRRPTAISGWGS